MRRSIRKAISLAGLLLAGVAGCGKKSEPAPAAPTMPTVTLTHPAKRDILRVVGQPAFVNAYEQTSVFPKLTGFIEKWNVDIGDKVKKDQVLATLFIPELVEEHRLKKAKVELDRVLVDQSRKMVDAADGTLRAAVAKVEAVRKWRRFMAMGTSLSHPGEPGSTGKFSRSTSRYAEGAWEERGED